MFSRRTILQSAGKIGAVTVFAGSLYGLRAAAQATVPLRRSLGSMDLDDPDLESYRQFVAAMKAKPANDPAGWMTFSAVHGSDPGGFNFCPHGTWYFLPWHRAYLQMYEIACRQTTGSQGFALPYWDWTADRQLPKAFTDEQWNGQPNPLFEPSRTMAVTDSLPDDMVGQTQVMDGIMSETVFEMFGTSRPAGQNNLDPSWIGAGGGVSGALEGNPHNRVHCRVGGIFCRWGSPRDAIFMMHHGNIDRIWAQWIRNGNSSTTDPLWLDMPFDNHFIAPDGSHYTKVVRDLLDTIPLGYTYWPPEVVEPNPPDMGKQDNYGALLGYGSKPTNQYVKLTAAVERQAEALRPLATKIPIEAAALNKVLNPEAAPEGKRPPEVVAIIRDVMPPSEDTTEYRVFVNCDYLSQEVPTSDPHYVTTFSFFGGHEGGNHRGARSFLINLTDALKRLERGKQLSGDNVVVQILPVPRPGAALESAAPIKPTQVELGII